MAHAVSSRLVRFCQHTVCSIASSIGAWSDRGRLVSDVENDHPFVSIAVDIFQVNDLHDYFVISPDTQPSPRRNRVFTAEHALTMAVRDVANGASAGGYFS